MNKTPYHELTLNPFLVADTVCGMPYTGEELSPQLRSGVEHTEKLRQAMTPERRREFCALADKWCADAYAVDADWFSSCLCGNRGRDELYMWVSHWLCAYLRGSHTLTGDREYTIRQATELAKMHKATVYVYCRHGQYYNFRFHEPNKECGELVAIINELGDLYDATCPQCDGLDPDCYYCHGFGKITATGAAEWHRQNEEVKL